MTRLTLFGAAASLLLGMTAAHAGIIVNLSADATTPNAGNNSPGYTYNAVNVALSAGTYTVGVVGTAGGGLYDAYSVYAPTSTNGAYTNGNWSVNVDGVVQTQGSDRRFSAAADALAYYAAKTPITFTLAQAGIEAFYLDDTVWPSFGDDAGGVSLAINEVRVPEPLSLTLLATGIVGMLLVRGRKWRRTAA